MKSTLKILCIGDSLTEGDYGSEPEGSKNVHDEGYPYFLNLFLDEKHKLYNQGACGFTTSAYYLSKLPQMDIKSMDPDIAIIMLGTNGGLTDTLDKDVIPFTDYKDYLETSTGYYCKIIDCLMEETKGKIQIILCTCPFVDESKRPINAINVEQANRVITQIASLYNFPLIDLYNELGVNRLNTRLMQPIDGLHYGIEGYSRMGTFIGSNLKAKLSYIMN